MIKTRLDDWLGVSKGWGLTIAIAAPIATITLILQIAMAFWPKELFNLVRSVLRWMV